MLATVPFVPLRLVDFGPEYRDSHVGTKQDEPSWARQLRCPAALFPVAVPCLTCTSESKQTWKPFPGQGLGLLVLSWDAPQVSSRVDGRHQKEEIVMDPSQPPGHDPRRTRAICSPGHLPSPKLICRDGSFTNKGFLGSTADPSWKWT